MEQPVYYLRSHAKTKDMHGVPKAKAKKAEKRDTMLQPPMKKKLVMDSQRRQSMRTAYPRACKTKQLQLTTAKAAAKAGKVAAKWKIGKPKPNASIKAWRKTKNNSMCKLLKTKQQRSRLLTRDSPLHVTHSEVLSQSLSSSQAVVKQELAEVELSLAPFASGTLFTDTQMGTNRREKDAIESLNSNIDELAVEVIGDVGNEDNATEQPAQPENGLKVADKEFKAAASFPSIAAPGKNDQPVVSKQLKELCAFETGLKSATEPQFVAPQQLLTPSLFPSTADTVAGGGDGENAADQLKNFIFSTSLQNMDVGYNWKTSPTSESIFALHQLPTKAGAGENTADQLDNKYSKSNECLAVVNEFNEGYISTSTPVPFNTELPGASEVIIHVGYSPGASPTSIVKDSFANKGDDGAKYADNKNKQPPKPEKVSISTPSTAVTDKTELCAFETGFKSVTETGDADKENAVDQLQNSRFYTKDQIVGVVYNPQASSASIAVVSSAARGEDAGTEQPPQPRIVAMDMELKASAVPGESEQPKASISFKQLDSFEAPSPPDVALQQVAKVSAKQIVKPVAGDGSSGSSGETRQTRELLSEQLEKEQFLVIFGLATHDKAKEMTPRPSKRRLRNGKQLDPIPANHKKLEGKQQFLRSPKVKLQKAAANDTAVSSKPGIIC